MVAKDSGRAVPIPAGQVDYLIATAARAPSVHNTQPWRFRAGHLDAIELYDTPTSAASCGSIPLAGRCS